jgi:hypothetical protein
MLVTDVHYRIGVVSYCPIPPSVSSAFGHASSKIDAIVLEDDTHHVLSADPAFREPKEHPVRIHTQALNAAVSSLGQICPVSSKPFIFRAVVHDLSRTPSVQLSDVKNAMTDLFVKCRGLDIGSVHMPLLGTVHGRLNCIHVLRLLRELSPSTGNSIRVFLELSRAQESMLKEHWADSRWHVLDGGFCSDS